MHLGLSDAYNRDVMAWTCDKNQRIPIKKDHLKMSFGYINIIINSTIYTDHWPSVPNYSESQGLLRRIIFKYQSFVLFCFNEIKWADNLGNLKRSYSMTTFEINLPIDPLGESPLEMRTDWPSTVPTILRTHCPSDTWLKPLHTVTHLPSILMRDLLASQF